MNDGYVYKKITASDIDLPRYCHFFIKEIQDSLDEYNIYNTGDEIKICIESYKHPYCYDAFALVVKAFERKGYTIKIPSYKMEKDDDGDRKYIYNWELVKIGNTDDLPF